MALYRFLFAPVLLAVAVAVGDGAEPGAPAAPAAEVRVAPPPAAPAPPREAAAEPPAATPRPPASR